MKSYRNGLLLLFIVTTFSTVQFSCKKIVEPSRSGDFYFVNKTSHTVSFEYYSKSSIRQKLEKYTLAPNATILVKQTQESDFNVSASSYHTPFITEYGFNEPLIVTFDNKKCLSFSHLSKLGPLQIINYVSEKISDRSYRFTYTVTEEDYQEAVACP